MALCLAAGGELGVGCLAGSGGEGRSCGPRLEAFGLAARRRRSCLKAGASA